MFSKRGSYGLFRGIVSVFWLTGTSLREWLNKGMGVELGSCKTEGSIDIASRVCVDGWPFVGRGRTSGISGEKGSSSFPFMKFPRCKEEDSEKSTFQQSHRGCHYGHVNLNSRSCLLYTKENCSLQLANGKLISLLLWDNYRSWIGNCNLIHVSAARKTFMHHHWVLSCLLECIVNRSEDCRLRCSSMPHLRHVAGWINITALRQTKD